MKNFILALAATQCVFATCHPYVTSIESWSTLQNAVYKKPSSRSIYGEFINPRAVNTDGDHVALQARDTTSTDTSTTTTSTSPTTTSTTNSSTTTSSGTATTSSTIPDTSSTSFTSAISSISTTTSTTSTSTTSSSSTTSTSTSTTSESSATNSANGERAQWNRKGNITAVVFSVCLISLFSGISIAFCVSDKARKKRIAARELLKSTSSTISTKPLVPSRIGSLGERSTLTTKDYPLSDTPPRTVHS